MKIPDRRGRGRIFLPGADAAGAAREIAPRHRRRGASGRDCAGPSLVRSLARRAQRPLPFFGFFGAGGPAGAGGMAVLAVLMVALSWAFGRFVVGFVVIVIGRPSRV